MKASHITLRLFWLLCALLSIFQLSKPFWQTVEDDQPMDMRQIWVSAHLLTEEQNPYSDSLLKANWQSTVEKEALHSGKMPGSPHNYSVYPLHFLSLMKPMTRLSWRSFRMLWWCFLLALTLFLFVTEWRSFGWKIVLSFLAFKSFVVAIIIGQPLLVVLCAFVLLLRSEEQRNNALSTAMLLIISLKISLLIPLGLWMLIRGRFTPVLITSGVLLLAYLAIWISMPHFFQTLSSWLENMNHQWMSAYTNSNDLQYLLTESGILVKQFVPISSLQPALRYFLLGMGSLGLLLAFRKKLMDVYPLLFGLLLMGYMLSYHLIYDLALVIPVLWRMKHKLPAWSVFLALPAILPVNAMSDHLWLRLHIPCTLLLIAVIYVFLFVIKPLQIGSGQNSVY